MKNCSVCRYRTIKAESSISNHITIKAYLKTLDPFQRHLHFAVCFSLQQHLQALCALRKYTVLSQETWSHRIPVKYRQHHLPANSRCLWSPCSLLFAQAVVNMELQVALMQQLPTQQTWAYVCMWFPSPVLFSFLFRHASQLHGHICQTGKKRWCIFQEVACQSCVLSP